MTGGWTYHYAIPYPLFPSSPLPLSPAFPAAFYYDPSTVIKKVARATQKSSTGIEKWLRNKNTGESIHYAAKGKSIDITLSSIAGMYV
jgi:hypothetical protein